MNRRRFLCLAAPVALVALDGGRIARATTPSTPPAPSTPGTDAVSPTIPLPVDPATPVIRLTSEGGFVPRGWDFSAPPMLLITAGGDVYRSGAMTAEFPGPLLLPIDHQRLTPAGVQKVMRAADLAGLLAPPPDYNDVDFQITDVATTVLTITTGAGAVSHAAYALGISPDGSGKEVTPARQKLKAFVDVLATLDSLVGADLSAPTPFEPTEYRMVAFPVNIADYAGNDPQPVVKDWPASTGVTLSTADQCTRVASDQVAALFADASQLTFFAEAGTTYQVFTRGVLPGDATC